ncbi:MAG: hypothetical protein JNK82_09840 [Myxococcaceae bacterium]|nr:hypothetical protein [Myxococcaceae bacterium]
MNRLLLAAVLAVAACDAPSSPEAAATQKAQLADARGTCVKLFERQRACSAEFIPALVDVRRGLDKPAGIAKANRDELIAAAFAEWKSDSTDEAIGNTCDRMAGKLPPPAVETARGCIAAGPCGEFVTCVTPLVRAQLGQ